MRLLRILILASVAASAVGRALPASAQDDAEEGEFEPGESSLYGSFAFADTAGTRLLALSPLADPASIETLITQDGRRLRVVYEGEQRETGRGDGRDAARNFPELGGQRYRIVNDRIGAEQNCFLAGRALSVLGGPAALHRAVRSCAAPDSAALATAKRRSLARCWSLATADPDATVQLYEVAPIGKERVAGIAVATTKARWTLEYRARVSEEDPTTVWRVGDEGRLLPEAFDVLFLIQDGERWLVGMAWYGQESTYLNLYRSGENGRLRSVAGAYRYLAPY